MIPPILVIIMAISAVATTQTTQEYSHFSMIDVGKAMMLHDAVLIIEGRVTGQNDVTINNIHAINNKIQVEDVLRGQAQAHVGKSLTVISDDSLHNGQRAIFFLYKSHMFGGRYSIIGMQQGVFPTSGDTVRGKFFQGDISIQQFKEQILGIKEKQINRIQLNATSDGQRTHDQNIHFDSIAAAKEKHQALRANGNQTK
jgi:hypothetical protein